MDNRCILQLCDPDALPAREAIHLARQLSCVEPGLARNLAAFVAHLTRMPDLDPRAMRRALELLYAVSDPATFARACELADRHETPVAHSLLRWLAAETPRRMAKR